MSHLAVRLIADRLADAGEGVNAIAAGKRHASTGVTIAEWVSLN